MRWIRLLAIAFATLLSGAGAGDYPRPELARPALGEEVWLDLGEDWEYAAGPVDGGRPVQWRAEKPDAEIVGAEGSWSRKRFRLPKAWEGRVILHLEALDGDAWLELNGTRLGVARAWRPAAFALNEVLIDDEQQLLISGGGIAGPVWIEPVPESRVLDAFALGDIDAGSVMVHVEAELSGTALLAVEVNDAKGRPCAAATVGLTFQGAGSGVDHPVSTAVKLPLPNPHLWAPDSPYLYGLKVTLKRDGERLDSVEGQFGMRKISLGHASGVAGLQLNNVPSFQLGVASVVGGVAEMKSRGFDMVRVPARGASRRFYHECDSLGLFVWQDLPRVVEGFEGGIKDSVDRLRRHPSVIVWALGDDAAGAPVRHWLRRYDPGRLIFGKGGDIVLDADEMASAARVQLIKGGYEPDSELSRRSGESGISAVIFER